jgi:hypothetical protein
MIVHYPPHSSLFTLHYSLNKYAIYGKEVIQDIITIIETDSVTPQERAKMIKEFSDEEYLVDVKKEAKKEREIEIAKNLILAKVDINTIVISTGLSVEEIEKIDLSEK